MVEVLLHGVSLKMSRCKVSLHVKENQYILFSSNETQYIHTSKQLESGLCGPNTYPVKSFIWLENV